MAESNTRSRDGTEADRRPVLMRSSAARTGGYLSLGAGVATLHWVVKCLNARHFIMPDDALLEVAATGIFAPLDIFATVIMAKLNHWKDANT